MIKLPLQLIALASLFVVASGAGAVHDVSEKDYFSELPEVLTVTRLAQPLSETPGAVTIIDRDTIRRSGARELADVLRLVPGYLVGGWNGANPGAAYHAPLDDFGTRNLVLIDGRSVYSSFYLGDTHRGMMGTALEDVERIEVLRGSNSAAYGANAMFGVINIVTRHAMDSHGVELSVTSGEGGIKDNYARFGWGDARASHRLSMSRRQDSGYLQAYDDKIASQLNFRSDVQLANDAELMVSAGMSELAAGEGFRGAITNPERTTEWRSWYLHGQWQRRLASGDSVKLSASYDEEKGKDATVYALDPTVILDFGGRGRRLNLEFQHQTGISPTLRAVWGAGYKYEDALSPPLYFVRDEVSIHEGRVFGSLEWRPHPRWLVNAGGFGGKHSRKGSYFLPRLMLNFHVATDHTLRVGATESKRMPNLYELAADRRYYLAAFPAQPLRYDAATGQVAPETLKSHELGYFGNFRDWRLTLDVRAYHERMLGVVQNLGYVIPGYVNPIAPAQLPNDLVNMRNFTTHGIEYQLRWKPFTDTEIWLNQNVQRYHWDDGWTNHKPPMRAMTFALFQKLPLGLDLGLIHYTTSSMTWRDHTRVLDEIRRTDVRLAYPFRVGATRAEVAMAVQAADGNYMASYPDRNYPRMIQERRAYGTLRVEF